VLWSGWDGKVGKLVYVNLYRTQTAAKTYARSLSSESVATVGLYAVNESITSSSGSPVPAVAACLGGKSKKAGNKKHHRSFTF
jgi:hypothetical protein